MASSFKPVSLELQRGMRLARCRKCGCMGDSLENLRAALPSLRSKEAGALLKEVNGWLKKLAPRAYSCLGCKYCIPAEAMAVLTSKYTSIAAATLTSCEFEATESSWPMVTGEYTVLNKSAPIAVSTLASVKLEERLARLRPPGLCIVGKTETENIGIDKVIKNIIANPAIAHLILAGKDTEGHQSGQTLLALWENGVNKNMRVIGSKGRRPILKNVSLSEIKKFRKQVRVVDQINNENVKLLVKRIGELSGKPALVQGHASCGCQECHDEPVKNPRSSKTPPRIMAKKPGAIKLDKAGYFVIIPSKKNKVITVEHYSYDNKLLRTIEGKNSRNIYHTIISNKWVKDLGHAAYLGKELARAELSIKKGFKFVQDGA
ncbi:tetrahydromethanopterin S-methyltransferase subunit A [bacterium BMS3Bbin08]|nr:tetrahydromethanopterin S-methyltransferase subunit A [bacterium BMS3Bbin08]